MLFEQSQQLLNKAIAFATNATVNVNIAVCDAGGNLCAFQRMDGSPLGSVDIAQKKARSAVLFGAPTEALGQLVREQQLDSFEQTNEGLILFAGGEPVFHQGQLIGGVGISGGSAAEDKMIALAAIDQAGFTPAGATDEV
ncbi:heme-binding protein [uncultured Amphritea sp.]|uniref:GlcG/HbpS family heme-binding protein n=1 Tax=uncultured Amphritea sp. TaxID=981605 RepID=UPI00260F9089|nr:heme-binding protein [uncultured Amphritea sp.]